MRERQRMHFALHIPWLYLTLSSIVTFALLLLMARWIGSTQLTQLTFFNWVAGASMGNIAANMIATPDTTVWLSNAYTLIAFTGCSVAAAYIALKSRAFRRVANGEPTVLIHKGKMLRENLAKTQVNVDVLMMMLREKGYFSYSDIEFAVLEPTGNLSILPTQASQSATKEDLAKGPDLSDKGQGPYVELVIDGDIDYSNLHDLGRDESWLRTQLDKLNVKSTDDVMYMGVNPEGDVIADVRKRLGKRDHPVV